jgi:hypothetical protein
MSNSTGHGADRRHAGSNCEVSQNRQGGHWADGAGHQKAQRKDMSDELSNDLSKKLNVLIALSLRQLTSQTSFNPKSKRGKGKGDIVHFLSEMGLNAKDIAQIVGSPITSVRTLLTPGRRK